MQNRLQVFKATQYPHSNALIEIEKKRYQAYYFLVSTQDQKEADFVAYLKLEYGSKSENFLKFNRIGSYFHRGTGTGMYSIPSYIRCYSTGTSQAVFFDYDISQHLETELNEFNKNRRICRIK